MCARRREKSSIKPKDIPDLNKVLQDFIKSNNMEKGLYNSNIITVWNEIVGEKFAGISSAFKYADRILYVKIESSVWRNEFHYIEKDIINRYNERFKSEVVRKILVY